MTAGTSNGHYSYSISMNLPGTVINALRQRVGFGNDKVIVDEIIRILAINVATSKVVITPATTKEAAEMTAETIQCVKVLEEQVAKLTKDMLTANSLTDRLIGIVEKQANNIEQIMAQLIAKTPANAIVH